METLTELAPALSVTLGPMLAAVIAIMRYQHVDNTKSRDLIEKNHREVTSSLGEVRERLAHIEGYLEGWPSPQPPSDEGDALAA